MGVDPASLAAPFLAMGDAPKASGASRDPSWPPPDLTVLMRKMAEAASGERPAQEVLAEVGFWPSSRAPR